MGRRREDQIDVICKAWGREFRRLKGMDDPKMERALTSEFLGAIRSTLGQRRDLHAGATSSGRVEQFFPEVMRGDILPVHNAMKSARPGIRNLLLVHYVARAPIEVKAGALAVSVPTYWNRVAIAKGWVDGWLAR